MTPNQTQPSSPSMTPQGGLDPDVVTFTKAVAMQEGGGSLLPYDHPSSDFPNAPRGTAGGRYQFIPDTWKNYAQQVLGDANAPMTDANQNQVAYTKMKQWKDSGKSWAQMASMWNAGENAPDSWQNSPKVAQYAKNVQRYAQQIQSGQSPMVTPTASKGSDGGVAFADSSVEGQQKQSSEDPALTGIPVVDSIANFLFPAIGDIQQDIAGKSTKTPLQQAGDVGLSVLPFIPGLGELGEGARGVEAAGMLPKLLGSRAVQGAGLGYSAGALGNLSQGQSLGQAISPNIGTLGGAALGGAANTILPKIFEPFTKNLTQGGAVSAVENNLESNAKRWQGLRTMMSKMPNGGSDAIGLIARTPGALPAIEEGTFNSSSGASKLLQQERAIGDIRAAALDKLAVKEPSVGEVENKVVPPSLTDLQEKAQGLLQEQFKDSPFEKSKGTELAADIQKMVENYGGDTITYRQLEKIKESFPYNSPIARASRQMLEDAAKRSGAPDLGDLNKLIQTHINARQILGTKGLHGKVVKGGRLGNMLRGHTMAVIGAGMEGAFGGGVLGTIGGALGGELLSKMFSRWTGETSFTNPVRDAILDKISQEDPAILQQYSHFIGSQQQVAPQRSPSKNSYKSGVLRRLLISGAARAPAASQPTTTQF